MSSMCTSSMNRTPGTSSAMPWSMYLLTTLLISFRNLSDNRTGQKDEIKILPILLCTKICTRNKILNKLLTPQSKGASSREHRWGATGMLATDVRANLTCNFCFLGFQQLPHHRHDVLSSLRTKGKNLSFCVHKQIPDRDRDTVVFLVPQYFLRGDQTNSKLQPLMSFVGKQEPLSV